ncbi:DNA-binding transcriptional regulator GbsR (MarR family) [Methanohalophilus levihalophilus]|uniref:GbsR/MarR family transcriptional regulator n=1 Tax=Methanohalophilus levihalophilus TaxID=1431282 RepID=UPI001AE4EDF9|nr:hypothetical protein [Methanohalophilus levihalophilus]MBP2030314.1 DNA-binding transcriptional regulator GbsR (MarR family) [Methanohalophilus levihalophilus]
MSEKNDKVAHIIPSRIGGEGAGKGSLLGYPTPEKLSKKLSRTKTTPRDEFLNLIMQNMLTRGFDSISSKIVAVLFIEPREISLEELSQKTGYSLSAVSTAMKGLDGLHVVKRIKKPGSRKVFFYLDKNIISAGIQILKTKYEKVIAPSKRVLPEIIEKYKFEDSENSREELEIIQMYYLQLQKYEKLIKDFLDAMEEVEGELNLGE